MNPWHIEFCYLLFLLIFLMIGIISVILIIKGRHKKKNIKFPVISLVSNSLLLLILTLFGTSHHTYYKYNDWSILGSNISTVRQKYGAFDLGDVTDKKASRAAYYIYTDNGPIMPDHLKHYYYIEYDEEGIIYKVYDACQPGG
ncbi:hypothetical protein [Ruminococcus albus]|uniref:Uncharacterized protein n=1 Tax=Ruminococcus albus TaxID=1264 RepID=A0A1I1QQF0_RUMAL|nr:hypothetical protein [Ruminococcus albus]SFD24247.1 hypothetical protein SAMN02910406_03476 [Ruminococcus albus]